jgi:hypothetical protein
MEINQLRDEVVKAVKEKYPNEWDLENRYISLARQVGGFGESLQFRTGKIPKCDQHDTMQHQIACIMVDLFMLSDLLNADVEKELLSAISWFKAGKK